MRGQFLVLFPRKRTKYKVAPPLPGADAKGISEEVQVGFIPTGTAGVGAEPH